MKYTDEESGVVIEITDDMLKEIIWYGTPKKWAEANGIEWDIYSALRESMPQKPKHINFWSTWIACYLLGIDGDAPKPSAKVEKKEIEPETIKPEPIYDDEDWDYI